jgi:hypothetical protein
MKRNCFFKTPKLKIQKKEMNLTTFLSVIILFFITAGLLAQSRQDSVCHKFTIGVLGGLNIPDLSGGNSNELSSNYTSRQGEAFGITASYSIDRHFDIVADALYSSEGGKRDGAQAYELNPSPLAPSGSYLYATFNSESILNYFEIPVMLKYSFNLCNSSKFYIDFGPMVGFLLNATQKTGGSSLIYQDAAETEPIEPFPVSFNESTTVTSSIRPFNFSLTGGIGFKQGVGFGDIFIDIRGAYGLTYVQKNIQADGTDHIGNLCIAVGYSIPL